MYYAILNKYQYIFALVPFVGLMIYGIIKDMFPKKSYIGKVASNAMMLITESDIDELLAKNNFSKTSVKTYQILRLIISSIGILAAIALVDGSTAEKVIMAIVLTVVIYKGMYFYLKIIDKARIKKMNEKLPYAIKTIAYMAYIYPVSNAIEKSIPIVPKEFEYDLKLLFNDINKDPISFKPYQNFIDRYHNRLNQLEPNLKLLYRMTQSGGSKSHKLLSMLNNSISQEVNRIRVEKNKALNAKIGWFGFIPVLALVAVLIYLLVLMTMIPLSII